MQGIISIGANFYLQSVAMKEKGLVFVTAFSPLTCRVVVTAIGSIIFSEQMNLGRYNLSSCFLHHNYTCRTLL